MLMASAEGTGGALGRALAAAPGGGGAMSPGMDREGGGGADIGRQKEGPQPSLKFTEKQVLEPPSSTSVRLTGNPSAFFDI